MPRFQKRPYIQYLLAFRAYLTPEDEYQMGHGTRLGLTDNHSNNRAGTTSELVYVSDGIEHFSDVRGQTRGFCSSSANRLSNTSESEVVFTHGDVFDQPFG